MGVYCVRFAKPHFATAPFVDDDRRCVIGVVSPTCAAAFHCPDFLRRLETPLAVARGSCVQGTMSTSFAASDARPWLHGGTTTYAASQLHIAQTTHNCMHLPWQLVSTNLNDPYLLRTAQPRTLWNRSRVDVLFPTLLAYPELS